MSKLTMDHMAALENIQNGADILCKIQGRLLRELKKLKPDWLTIVEQPMQPLVEGRRPLFGAIATWNGKNILDFGDDSVCPVEGRHKEEPMGDVPGPYLDWLHGQKWLPIKYPQVWYYIEKNREAIDKELQGHD